MTVDSEHTIGAKTLLLQPASSAISQPIKKRARLLTLSTALMLFSGAALAQDTGKAAFDAYVAGLEKLGLEVENGSVDYDAGSDTLTLTNSKITFSGTLEDFPAEETDVTGNDGGVVNVARNRSAEADLCDRTAGGN